MHSDTVFAPDLSYTNNSLEETQKFLNDHKVDDLPAFTEAISHSYDSENKRFSIDIDGQRLNFTHPAYLEFCSAVGIPSRFASKIPNDLLLKCVDEMLADSNNKVRLLIRDKNVICGCRPDKFVSVKPSEFLEAAGSLTDTHMFREANVSDCGTNLLFEPMSGQTISPNVENKEDQFNVGIAFSLGMTRWGQPVSGLVEAHPYSLRHVCINVAVSQSDTPKYQLVERIKRRKRSNAPSQFFNRLIENYQSDRYATYMNELNSRIEKALNNNITDFHYVQSFRQLNRMLGEEVTLSLLGVTEERHEEIMVDVDYKKKKDEWSDKNQKELEDLNIYELFNSVTAAAKGYTGLDRVSLLAIGGQLI